MVGVQSVPGPATHAEERAHEADHPSSQVAVFGLDQPLKLDCGIDLAPFQIAYQTYGELNAARSNAQVSAVVRRPNNTERPSAPRLLAASKTP